MELQNNTIDTSCQIHKPVQSVISSPDYGPSLLLFIINFSE